MEEFINRYRYPSESVNTKLHMEAQTIMEANQKVVESLIRVIMESGKQGLALCGHHGDKIVWNEQDELDFKNHGNFIELVHFMAETNEVLDEHLQNVPKNAHYNPKKLSKIN